MSIINIDDCWTQHCFTYRQLVVRPTQFHFTDCDTWILTGTNKAMGKDEMPQCEQRGEAQVSIIAHQYQCFVPYAQFSMLTKIDDCAE
jgi:hypothetical protein